MTRMSRTLSNTASLWKTCIVAAAFCSITPVFGQENESASESTPQPTVEQRLQKLESESESQRELIDQYKRRIEELESNQTSKPQKSESSDREESILKDFKIGRFFIESESGKHKLQFGLTAAFYGIYSFDNDEFNNSIEARYVRFTASGFVYKWIEYQIDMEFGRTAAADLRNAFVNLHPIDEFQVKIGQMLFPFSVERLNPIAYLTHPERPIIIADSVLQFELGAMIHGSIGDGLLKYYVGVFNGNGHNQARDNNDGKDLAARIEVQPIKGISVSASAIWTPSNRNYGPLSDVATVGDQVFRFLDYSAQTSLRGQRERYSLGLLATHSCFQVMADFILEFNEDYRNAAGLERDFLTIAGYLDISVLLTGEKKTRNFEPESEFYQDGEFGTGAWELAVRGEFYTVDRSLLRNGYATGANQVISETVSINWYPHTAILIGLSYIRSDFNQSVRDSGGKAHRYDNTAMLRMSLHF